MRRKGGLFLTGLFTKTIAIYIITAVAIGLLIFRLIVSVGSLPEARAFLPRSLTGLDKTTFSVEFVKLASEPYIYGSMISYMNDGIMLDQSLLAMYSGQSKYFDSSLIRDFISYYAPQYFSVSIRDYNTPSNQLELFKVVQDRCGDKSEATCEKICPSGTKEDVALTQRDCPGPSLGLQYQTKCCVEDLTIANRCGPASNPTLGLCEKECSKTRKETNYGCSSGMKCCVTSVAEDETIYSWYASNQRVIYTAEIPLFYKGKAGYVVIGS